jgi:hypothetical protein
LVPPEMHLNSAQFSWPFRNNRFLTSPGAAAGARAGPAGKARLGFGANEGGLSGIRHDAAQGGPEWT